MATNQFKPFAASAGANVTAQAQYESLSALATGFTSGTARSDQVNKALRQGTSMAAMIGAFMAIRGLDALDDGDTSTLESRFEDALSEFLLTVCPGKAGIIYYSGIPTSGQVTTQTQTLSFVAPCDGWVRAAQCINIGVQSGIQPGSQKNEVTITGSTSGAFTINDSTRGSMTNSCVKKVVAGETVAVKGSVTTDGASGEWGNNGITLDYVFTPGR